MAIVDVLGTMRQALADARSAEDRWRDPAFRLELRRDPRGALRVSIQAVPRRHGQSLRHVPRSWWRRLELTRRPVL